MAKTMTVRLPDEQAANLETLARVDGIHVSEAVRQAIDERIQARRADKEFQARLQRLMSENRQALERLSK
jgi:Arc/MetJ-type ribon-helix-helix transcriptional regulator